MDSSDRIAVRGRWTGIAFVAALAAGMPAADSQTTSQPTSQPPSQPTAQPPAQQADQAARQCKRDGSAPPSFRLAYDVQASRGMLGMTGENELRFERDGARYTLVSETTAAPLYSARQASRGTVAAHGLVPHEYAESRTRRAETRVNFDWAAGEVALGAAGTRVPAPPRLQDRLTLLLEVGRLAPARSAAPLEITVAGVRRVEPYLFTTGMRETIDVPAGRFETLRIARVAERPAGSDGKNDGKSDGGNEREDRLELWLAPSLCGLPVRLRYRDEHGLVIENTLKAVELRR